VDYSGERFIPQHADPNDEIAVEHQQRYHAVSNLVRGKTVLDAGSGEGYGAHRLAETAARVVGMDISLETVKHAIARYQRPNLQYQVGSADALPFPDRMFDIVVSFEVIEHLEESLQTAFLREARRVLKENGVLVISTPNRAVYTDEANQHNQFHKHEFYVEEFESFLREVFRHISLFAQGWYLSSALLKTRSANLQNLDFPDSAELSPKYVVALCGARETVETADLACVVIDRGRRFERMRTRILELQTEITAKNAWAATLEYELAGARKRIVELQEEIVQRNDWAAVLEEDLAGSRARVGELQSEISEKNSWNAHLGQEIEGLRGRIVGLQSEVAEKNSWAASLEGEIALTRARISELQAEIDGKNLWIVSLEKDLGSVRKRVVELQEEIKTKDDWASSLEQQIRNLEAVLTHYKTQSEVLESRHKTQSEVFESRLSRVSAQNESLLNIAKSREAELTLLRGELDLIKQSDFWKVASRYWRLRDRLLPLGSRRRRLLKRSFGFLKPGKRMPAPTEGAPQRAEKDPSQIEAGPAAEDRTADGIISGVDAKPVAWKKLDFATVETPRVSILIPAFNQWEFTYRCLQSILHTMAGLDCEIILADDGSSDATVNAGDYLSGVRILRDGKNRGFLGNCNWAADQARGEYLYVLNNDTELRPEALQALVSLLDCDGTVGMVGSKLVFPDGRIQEAGGIVWADASAWNFGRGQDASLPAYNYVKEVDYVSGASFMIRRTLWREIGGFDDQYAPAYCEDSDLAFEVRKRGYKVVYQPQSVVVHHEGVSHGTDVSSGFKAHQVRNTGTLKAKWATVLSRHFPNGTDVFHARDRSAGKKTILIVDHYVPHFDRDAGSRTMWSFIQAFLGMGLNVKFLGDNFFAHQPYTDVLQQSGVEVLVGPWFGEHWPEWLEENGHHIDFVLLNRPHIAPKYLRPVRAHTKARILFYVHDLHYLRESHLAQIQGDAAGMARAEKTKAEERRLMSQMDVILSCSDTEAAILREMCPDVAVHYVPPYSVDVDMAWDFQAARRSGLLFVGGFGHPPNGDGVLWFVREIWPAVQAQLPGTIFSIAGSDPPEEIRALASDRVQVLGFVTDERLKELYSASRLVVVPLRYGAGVKGKTVEAMAYGVPLVCTKWGVEGMPGIEECMDPRQCSGSMAEAIAGLYNDDARLKEISMRERTYVAHHFTIERIRAAFVRVVDPCMKDAETHCEDSAR
jgi:O-antigen biosynthesis protein